MRKIIKYPIIYITILIILITIFIFIAKIPKTNIKNNMLESAKYLNENSQYYCLIKENKQTKIDHYADSITLNILYSLDGKDTLKSMLYSKFYNDESAYKNQNLLETVENDYEPNMQYIRYWHGEVIFLKILLLIFNIKQIYIFNAVILVILLSILFYKLKKDKNYSIIIGLIIGLIVTNSYVVPFSIEYTSMYILSFIISIIIIKIINKQKENLLGILFFITGMLTCFFDFLTVETLTFTLPTIILLVYKFKSERNFEFKKAFLILIKYGILWSLGYVIMWITKWGISSIILNVNITDIALENAVERIQKTKVYEDNPISKSSVLRNVYLLTPLYFLKNKGVALFVFIFIYFSVLFLTRKEYIKIKFPLFLYVIALIPYVRYLILNNHSYLHYFFTYRAQLIVILILVVSAHYIIDYKMVKKSIKLKCKYNN